MNRPWRLIRDAFAGSHFARSVAVLAGGTAAGQAIIVLTSPILTRLYTPEDFGVLAVYVSTLSILVVVASLRYELAIPLPGDDEAAANLLILSLTVVLGVGMLSGGAVWLFGDQLLRWTNAPAMESYLWLLPLSLVGAGAYQVLNYWAIRRRAFFHVARTKLYQSVAQVLAQISLGLIKLGPGGLLLGDVAGRAGGSGTLAALAFRRDAEVFKRVSVEGIKRVAVRYRRFPLLSSGSSLLNSAGLQLPAILLAAFYGPQVAGWFALGQRVVGVPAVLVGRAVAQVYIGEAARLARESPAELDRLFSTTARRLLFAGIVPIALLVAGGPLLFELVFGENWSEAGSYLRILGAMFLVQFVVVPLSQTLNVLERQDLQLVWDAGRLLLVVGGLVLAYVLDWTAWTAIAIYSISMFAAYAVLYVMANVSVMKMAGRS
jgi:O-antigen/teichoic acid export membrane protein